MAGPQREFHVVAVLAHRPAQALLRLADPVLDRVLVQHQLLGGRLVAARVLQEDQQGAAQPGVVLVVGGQPRERAEHPGPQQVGGPEHHRHGRDLAERHRPRRGSSRGERDRLGGEGLLVGKPEPGRPLRRVAEGDMDAGVEHGPARCRRVERVPAAQRQPGPPGRLVAGQEHRIAIAARLRRDAADSMLQPGDLVGGTGGVARPAHQAHVVLTQPVAEGRLGGAHVDRLAGEQVADPRAPRGAAVQQPVLPLACVGRDHLLGYLVDIASHDPGHAQRRGAYQVGVTGLLRQFPEHPVGEARVPEPVGAQQRGQRRAALRQPARVFGRRGRRLHRGQVDPVLHDLQAGVDVAVHARRQQREHRGVVTELRDLAEYHLIDIAGHGGAPAGHRRGHVRHDARPPCGLGIDGRLRHTPAPDQLRRAGRQPRHRLRSRSASREPPSLRSWR